MTVLVLQGVAGLACVGLFVAWVCYRGANVSGSTTVKQLLLWYPLSAPWLLIRTPLLWGFIEVGLPLWSAVILEFLIERPLFFLTAREIAWRVK